MRDPAPAPQGRALERVGEDSARDVWGRTQGELPLKGGRPLLEGNHVFSLPYASRLSTFQAPGWGVPAVFSPHRWRNATPRELVPFNHRLASRIFIMQPAASLHRRSPKMVTSSLMVGKASRAAAPAPPSASRIFVIQAKMEDEASRGAAPARVGCPFLPLASGGEWHPPVSRRLPPAMPG
jgi:hypothetical protein